MSLLGSLQNISTPLMQEMGKENGLLNKLSNQDAKDWSNIRNAIGKINNSFQKIANDPGVSSNLKFADPSSGPVSKSIPENTHIGNIGLKDSSQEGFENLLTDAVKHVDEKQKIAAAQAKDVLMGRSDNLHQAVLSMRESQLAFNLLVEVRNHLMDGMQELTRLQVG